MFYILRESSCLPTIKSIPPISLNFVLNFVWDIEKWTAIRFSVCVNANYFRSWYICHIQLKSYIKRGLFSWCFVFFKKKFVLSGRALKCATYIRQIRRKTWRGRHNENIKEKLGFESSGRFHTKTSFIVNEKIVVIQKISKDVIFLTWIEKLKDGRNFYTLFCLLSFFRKEMLVFSPFKKN